MSISGQLQVHGQLLVTTLVTKIINLTGRKITSEEPGVGLLALPSDLFIEE